MLITPHPSSCDQITFTTKTVMSVSLSICCGWVLRVDKRLENMQGWIYGKGFRSRLEPTPYKHSQDYINCIKFNIPHLELFLAIFFWKFPKIN